MPNSPTAASKRLYSLTELELSKLATLEPNFLFEYLPWVMLSLRPGWVIKYQDQWLYDNCPSYLLNHFTNPELGRIYPKLMFGINPRSLIENNPIYLITEKREWVETFHPELLKEFSTTEYKKSKLVEKGKRNFGHILVLFYKATLGSFFGLFRAKSKYEMLPEKNPFISLDTLQEIEKEIQQDFDTTCQDPRQQ